MNGLQACIYKLKVKFNPLFLKLEVDNYWTSVRGLYMKALVTASEVKRHLYLQICKYELVKRSLG